jgi:hypothetical protein
VVSAPAFDLLFFALSLHPYTTTFMTRELLSTYIRVSRWSALKGRFASLPKQVWVSGDQRCIVHGQALPNHTVQNNMHIV